MARDLFAETGLGAPDSEPDSGERPVGFSRAGRNLFAEIDFTPTTPRESDDGAERRSQDRLSGNRRDTVGFGAAAKVPGEEAPDGQMPDSARFPEDFERTVNQQAESGAIPRGTREGQWLTGPNGERLQWTDGRWVLFAGRSAPNNGRDRESPYVQSRADQFALEGADTSATDVVEGQDARRAAIAAQQQSREATSMQNAREGTAPDDYLRRIQEEQEPWLNPHDMSPIEADGLGDRMGELFWQRLRGLGAGGGRTIGTLMDEAGIDYNSDVATWLRRRTQAAEAYGDRAVEGTTSWDDLKDSPTLTALFNYVAEQGASSVADMGTLASGAGVPAWIGMQGGNIAQDRAEADGRGEASGTDLLIGLGAGTGSAALERAGLQSIFGGTAKTVFGRIAQATAGEALTEALQNPLEYAASSVGTREGFDPMEAIDQGFAGAVAGGPMGGGMRGGVEVVDATGRLINRRRGDNRTPPPGIREQAAAEGAQVTQEDIDSPLDTADIAAGRAAVAEAAAGQQVEGVLGELGMPPAGSPVLIDYGQGVTEAGTIRDVFEDESGRGVVIERENGPPLREYLDTLADAGVAVRATGTPEQKPGSDAALKPDPAEPAALPLPGAQQRAEVAPPSEGRPSPVDDGGAIIRQLFGDRARITSTRRSATDPLTQANPRSWHANSNAAVDMAPIEGMTFEEAKAQIEAAGYNLIEAINETGDGRSAHATGDHWHFVLGTGGPGVSTAPESATDSTIPPETGDADIEFQQPDLGDVAQVEEGQRVEGAAPAVLQRSQSETREGEPYELRVPEGTSENEAFDLVRSSEAAQPVLDPQGNPTGWLAVPMPNGDGTTLFHESRNQARRFTGKGWRQYAPGWAMDNVGGTDTAPTRPEASTLEVGDTLEGGMPVEQAAGAARRVADMDGSPEARAFSSMTTLRRRQLLEEVGAGPLLPGGIEPNLGKNFVDLPQGVQRRLADAEAIRNAIASDAAPEVERKTFGKGNWIELDGRGNASYELAGIAGGNGDVGRMLVDLYRNGGSVVTDAKRKIIENMIAFLATGNTGNFSPAMLDMVSEAGTAADTKPRPRDLAAELESRQRRKNPRGDTSGKSTAYNIGVRSALMPEQVSDAERDTVKPEFMDDFERGKKEARALMQERGLTAPTTSTAPEHQQLGVDNRELSEIVDEFNEAQQRMVQSGEKITHVFDPPAKSEIVRLNDKVKVYREGNGWMTPAEARAEIQRWKDHAAAQGKDPEQRSANANKVVLSLFDLSGEWSQPWREAGYDVWQFDIQADPDMGDVNNFSTDFFGDWFGDFEGRDIYAILAACPCTDFASSGARHFAAKDADGRTVASVRLVQQTLAAIEYFKPAVWALENPVGRIEKLTGLPPWRLSFDPNHIGETYTKKTLIWGRFNGDLPIAPVDPVEGSKMHKQYGGKSLATKNARSVTPEGFAYSFFMANNQADQPAMAVQNKYDRLNSDLLAQAINSGITEEQISDAVDDFYYQELDDEAANSAVRALMDGGTPPRGTTTAPTYRLEDTPSGKGLALFDYTDAQVQALRDAGVPIPPVRKDGAMVFSKKREDDIRGALEGVTETVTPAPTENQRMVDAAKAARNAAKRAQRDEAVQAVNDGQLEGSGRVSLGAGQALTVRMPSGELGVLAERTADLSDNEFRNLLGMADRIARVAGVNEERAMQLVEVARRGEERNAELRGEATNQEVLQAGIDAGRVEIVDARSKPARRTDTALEKARDVTMRDWRGTEVPAWDEQGQRGDYDGGPTKDAFLKDGKDYLTAVSQLLTQQGFETKPGRLIERGKKKGQRKTMPAVSVNPGGPAVAGDVYLEMYRPNGGRGVQVQIGMSAMNGPDGGASLIARPMTQRDGRLVQGDNNWWPVDLTAEQLVERLVQLAPESAARASESDIPREPTPRRKGEKAWARGRMRQDVPSTVAVEDRAEFFSGWDTANIAAPVEDAPMQVFREAILNGKTIADAVAATTEAEQSKPDQEPATPASPREPSKNRLVTDERAEELRKRLKEKLNPNRLNSGIDPEVLAIGTELGVYHIEKGARRFTAWAKAIAADLDMPLDTLRRYLRGWYNGARDMMEDSGESVAGMDDADEVGRSMRTFNEWATEPVESATETSDVKLQDRLSERDAGTRSGDVQRTAPVGRDGRARGEEGGGSAGAVRAAGERDGDAAERRAAEPGTEGRDQGTGLRDTDGVSGRDAGTRTDSVTPAPGAIKGTDWVIEPGSLSEERSPAQKARDNIAAIETVKRVEAEGRPATREEQAQIARYVGWGGLKNAFPDTQGRYGKGFEEVGPRLRELLTDEEYETAKRSIQYAHYTGETVVRSMWQLAERLGFRGGQVFEPGMGTGNFVGMMPANLKQSARYAGLEYDHLTASIAKLLYPQSGVRQGDYTAIPAMFDAVDLVIGNPPFSETSIKSDPEFGKHGFLLHDFFFAKALAAVKPDGLLLFVTSAGTMNKQNAKAREFMAKSADLVGAIRLPGNTFEKNAGTSVTTDIVVLRKRRDGEPAGDQTWLETERVSLPDRNGGMTEGSVNRYFVQNPDMVLGEQGMFDQLTAGLRYAVRAPANFDLAAALQQAIEQMPAGLVDTAPKTLPPGVVEREGGTVDLGSGERKEGSFYLLDGKLMQFRNGVGKEVQQPGKGVKGAISKANQERIIKLVPVRDALREVYAADIAEDAPRAAEARKKLNASYDAFVKKFGPINKTNVTYRRPSIIELEGMRQEAREEARLAGREWEDGSFDPEPFYQEGAKVGDIARARKAAQEAAAKRREPWDEGSFDPADIPDKPKELRPNLDAFIQNDEEGYRLSAIEDYNKETGAAKKGLVFFENAVRREAAPTINGAQDALFYSLNRLGRPDLDFIAEQAGISRSEAREELAEQLFEVPGQPGTYQTAQLYLSGNVREKLAEAREAAERNPAFNRNVDALEAAQPTPLTQSEIAANLGMPWLPTEIIEGFATEALGLQSAKVTYLSKLAQWTARGNSKNSAATATWGTERMDAFSILEATLNKQQVVVRDTFTDAQGTKRTVVNEVESQAAQDKQQAIKDAFDEWVYADEARAKELVDRYNRDFNSLVAPTYDGSYLQTPGVNAEWNYRPHQAAVIARVIQSGNTYMAHEVGAGKTSAMIGAGMEMKRLGLANKPMYVVPNHMLGQFTKEFYEQYPTARIKVADEQRFHTSTRKQFIADVASEDLDAIIITHSSFKSIPISQEFADSLIADQIAELEELLAEIGKDPDMRITRRTVEQQKEQLQQRMAGALKGRKKDQVFTFEEMGVDFLFIDEAHMFRKLHFGTRMSNVKGVDPNGSQASFDLYAKTRYLEKRAPGRSHVLASGTPITNTMAELFSVSRFLQEQELAKRGLGHFDAWAGAFGDTATKLEQEPGGGYKPVTRFAQFVNVPELSVMVRQVMDVVGASDLRKYVSLPTLKGGSRQLIAVEQTENQLSYKAMLAGRMAAIKARSGKPQKGDDIILSVINDGRKAAIDYRLIDPTAEREDTKLERMIDEVATRHKEFARVGLHDPLPGGKGFTDKPVTHGPATQMIFSNFGINGDFPVQKYIKQQLIARGVKASEIALISDFKTSVAKQRLFNDMNEGKVRVLIGSVQKMGTGVNAQKRLRAIHNMDPLWYPADDTQRNGRGIRQGNMNPEIEILDYSTEGSYDSNMWDMMARKGRFIEGFMRGDPTMRDMEDLGEASQFEQAAALTTEDPRIMDLTEWKQEAEKLQRQKVAFERGKQNVAANIAAATRTRETFEKVVPLIEQDIAQRNLPEKDAFTGVVDGTTYDDAAEFGEALLARIDAMMEKAGKSKLREGVGSLGGFNLAVEIHPNFDGGSTAEITIKRAGDRESVVEPSKDSRGTVTKLVNAMARFETELENARYKIETAEADIADYTPQLEGTYDDGGRAAELKAKIDELEKTLRSETEAKDKAAQERLAQADPASEDGSVRQVKESIPEVSQAAWSSARIRDLLTQYAVRHEPEYTKSYVAWVTPQQFLDVTTPRALQSDVRGWAGELDAERLADEPQTPFLIVEDADDGFYRTVGHEGRHRMAALSRQGIERVPVVITERGIGWRALDPRRTTVLFAQRHGGDIRGEKNIIINSMLPLTYDNQAAIEQEFGDGELKFSRPESFPDLDVSAADWGKLPAPGKQRLEILRGRFIGWYRSALQGTAVTTADGRDVQFGKAGRGKTPRAGEDLLLRARAIPQIIEQGALISSEASTQAGIKAVHHYGANVSVDGGAAMPLLVIVREAGDGTFYYSLNRYLSRDASAEADGDTKKAIAPALDGDARDSLNLVPMAEEATTDAAEGVDIPALTERLERAGIARKVRLKIVDTLGGAAGDYGAEGARLIRVATDTNQDEQFTLDHETVHALRDMGVFNTSEWSILAAKAKRDPGLMRSIKRRYAKLDAEAQTEEAVADMYARWQRGDYEAKGTIAKLFKRLSDLFEAVRNAFAGLGLRSAEGIMQDVDSGAVGRRSIGDDSNSISINSDKPSLSVPETEALVALGGTDPTWKGKAGNAFAEWRRVLQDRHLPILKLQREIEEQTGEALPHSLNPYMGEELMTGRIGAQLEVLTEDIVAPLFDAMADEKVSIDELESYLYARHAPERNARINEINEDFEEGSGSGMTDLEARAIMNRIEADGKTRAMERLARRVDAIRDFAVDYRVESGLMSEEQAEEWRSTYENYVPLRGFAEVEGDPAAAERINRSGGGINVRGRESKSAYGRRSKADSPLAYLILQAEEAISRGETNRVAQRFVNLAKQFPDDGFWKVNKAQYRRRMNPDTGLVEDYLVNQLTADDAPYTVVAKFDGKERRVTMNRDNPAARKLADSARRLTEHQMDWVTLRLGVINRFLSAVNTSWNPEFVITNALRDIQTATINMQGIDLNGLTRGTLKDYRKALVAATKGAFRKGEGEWRQWYDEFVEEGGKVSFNKIEDVGQIKSRIESAMALAAAKNGEGSARLHIKRSVFAAKDLVESLNSGVENAVRLAAYKNARQLGMDRQNAASLAKNLTVNFNRRGAAGPALNALYLFFNASVQGSVRIIKAMRHRRVQKILAAVVASGFAMEMLNAMIAGDDDDGENFYDKVPDYEKERNLIIMLPGGDGSYVKIPMPYGYNAFYAAGRTAAEIGRRGGEGWKDSMGNLLGTVVDSFNPVGGTNSLLNFVSPTVVDPIVDLSQNRNFADNQIMPEQDPYGPPIPDSQRYWGSVAPHWRTIAETLSTATGGDGVTEGAIEVSPETLEYLAGVVVGAAGATLDRTATMGANALDPDTDVELSDVLFARKLVGTKPSWYDRSTFYDRLSMVELHVDRTERYIEAQEIGSAQVYATRHLEVLQMEQAAKDARRTMRQIRSGRREIEAAYELEQITDEQRQTGLDRLSTAEDAIVLQFNTQWNATMEAAAN